MRRRTIIASLAATWKAHVVDWTPTCSLDCGTATRCGPERKSIHIPQKLSQIQSVKPNSCSTIYCYWSRSVLSTDLLPLSRALGAKIVHHHEKNCRLTSYKHLKSALWNPPLLLWAALLSHKFLRKALQIRSAVTFGKTGSTQKPLGKQFLCPLLLFVYFPYNLISIWGLGVLEAPRATKAAAVPILI